jgi:hypothetical protein
VEKRPRREDRGGNLSTKTIRRRNRNLAVVHS